MCYWTPGLALFMQIAMSIHIALVDVMKKAILVVFYS